MPLTAAQIVTLANQAAKTPGFTSQAGQKLNDILQELCQTYDLAAARTLFTFTFNIGPNGTNIGSGPYSLPADYLRTQNGKQFYVYNGQPYFMTRVELWEYDALVQQPGFQDFPRNYTVDTSTNPPQEFVWPPPSISVPVSIRYFRQMPDIATPETSAVVPWFPYTNYLLTRLTGEMMAIADDTRAADFLTSNEQQNAQGAGVLLRRYLNMKDDPEGRAKTVELDGRRFGNGGRWNRLPNTKSIGWALAALWLGFSLFGGAHAQTSQATITAAIASAFPDNTSGQITPATTRSFLATLNGAIFQAQGANGLTLANPGANNQIPVSASGTTANWTSTPTLGVNGGTGGSITLNGATSGSATVSVNATGDTITSTDTIVSTGTVLAAPPAGATTISGLISAPNLTNNGSGSLWLTSTGGLHLQGAGSNFDVVLLDKTAGVAAGVPTGTQNFFVNGNFAVGLAGLVSGQATLNGATSGNDVLSVSATGGHAKFTSSSTPSLTAGCNGAGSVVSGTDQHGTITGQTAAATTCTLTFGTTFGATPDCVASGQSSPLTGAFTPSASTIVVSFASTANFKWSYICFGT